MDDSSHNTDEGLVRGIGTWALGANIMNMVFGGWGAQLLLIGMIISIFGCLSGDVLHRAHRPCPAFIPFH